MSLLTNIVAYWKFQGNSADSVGSDNGIDTNITYSTGNGLIGEGAGFDGSTSQITTAASQNLSGNWSMCGWFKSIYTGGSFNTLIGFSSAPTGGTTNSFLAMNSSTGSYHALFQQGGTTLNGVSSLNDGNWHFLCVTVASGTAASLYVDAATVVTGTIASVGSAIYPRFGVLGAGNYMSGSIDEIGLWSRTLTGTEVAQLYNSGAGFQYPFVKYNLTFSDSVMNGASRFTVLGRKVSYHKSLTASIMNGASRLAVLSKGKIIFLTDSIMNGASRFAILFFPTSWKNPQKSPSSWTNRPKQQ